MRVVDVVALVAFSACSPTSNAVVCSDGRVCPTGTTCNDVLDLCVTGAQTAACEGLAEGAACDVTDANEVCQMGICLPFLCGDGMVSASEVCDDGNTVPGDGCSAFCDSDETCSNGVVDAIAGEECDDGGRLEHDGCSSVCRVETPSWKHRPVAPSARMASGAVYDSARNRILLVGGLGNQLSSTGVSTQELDDAWEYDGLWRASPAQPPPPRGFFAMAYDSDRKRVVLHAGASNGLPETWEFDGSSWSLVSTSGPNRIEAAIAYDAVRKRVVLHGGVDPSDSTGTPAGDQWAWNGTAWSALALPNTGISLPRVRARMVFDPKRGRLVLFGGATTTGTLLDDLWEYDGTSWIARSATGAPTARASMAMSWNATCACVVIFGGQTGVSTVSGQTFTWDGTAWTAPTLSAAPLPRTYASFVPDGRGRSILTGGSRYFSTSSIDATAYLEDTWIFDGTQWIDEVAAARVRSIATFDTHRQRLVVYGGGHVDGPEITHDTFELSEDGWRLVDSSGPVDLGGSIAYDEARKETVLLGGYRPDSSLEPATWIWNGSAWASRTVATQATPRANGALVYDAERMEVVAFGGSDAAGSTDFNETWTWNGATWAMKTSAISPPARQRPAIGYDRVTKRVVMFGGFSNAVGHRNDTWVWDGASWTEHTAPVIPSELAPMMAWDPARKKLVLVSGTFMDAWEWTPPDGWVAVPDLTIHKAGDGSLVHTSIDGSGISVLGGYYPTLERTVGWELDWSSAHAHDVCRIAADRDGDMLGSCSDPDCWNVCTPGCLPGDICDPAGSPRCGDGACDAAESCRSCPMDCTTCTSMCGDDICNSGELCPGDCS